MENELSRRDFAKLTAQRGTAALLAPHLYSGPTPPAYESLIRTVADRVLEDCTTVPPFNWGEGVLMSGMFRAWSHTGRRRYLDFVSSFADYHCKQGISSTLAERAYCGHWGPGFVLLCLYEVTGKALYRKTAGEIVHFILTQAQRTQTGGLSHFSGKPQLWVDTLAMCCPVLSKMAALSKKPSLQEEAFTQLEIFARKLQDPQTGLYYHMWDEASQKRTPVLWARGNGWVVMAAVETLKNQPRTAAGRYARLGRLLQRQLRGIVKVQDRKSGLWHTILTDPASYLECSASSMFLYGMAEILRLKLLPCPWIDCMKRAYRGIAGKVDQKGRVTGVSAGTGPGSAAAYKAIPQGTYRWGTGAFLLAACAAAQCPQLSRRA